MGLDTLSLAWELDMIVVIKVAYLANDMALRMPSQKQETMIHNDTNTYESWTNNISIQI